MNTQLRHLSVFALVLIAVLIGATTYWQTWAQADLAARKDNTTKIIERLTIDRGRIFAADGTVLANNRVSRKHGLTIFTRHYPQNDLAPQVVGYSTPAGITTGLEQSLDDYLTGANTNLSNTFTQTLDKLGGQTVKGDNVYLTLRPGIQRLALDQLAGRCGAVVVLDAKTGAVVAMASSPTYNANLINQRRGFTKIQKIKGTCGDHTALQNNATAGLYPPGSTFKMVTAAAALDSGAYTPSSPFYDPGYCVDYGKRVSNAGNPDQNGPEAFGNVSLAEGFEHSINSVFCKVGMHIGGLKILDYAKRFGFYSVPPLETPPDESRASGLYNKGKLFTPDEQPADRLGPARVRPGADAGDAAPDGARRRHGRRQGTRAQAVPRPEGRRRRRLDGHEDPAADARPGDQAPDGCRAESDDAARRPGRDGRGDLPFQPQGRRQDGNGRARPRRRLRRLVRRLRPGR